jgi:hypothetical protein
MSVGTVWDRLGREQRFTKPLVTLPQGVRPKVTNRRLGERYIAGRRRLAYFIHSNGEQRANPKNANWREALNTMGRAIGSSIVVIITCGGSVCGVGLIAQF